MGGNEGEARVRRKRDFSHAFTLTKGCALSDEEETGEKKAFSVSTAFLFSATGWRGGVRKKENRPHLQGPSKGTISKREGTASK